MSLRTEIAISYNARMVPVSARCTHCGAKMPKSPSKTEFPADIALWFSLRIIEHKKLKHPNSRRIDDGRESLGLGL